MMAQYYLERLVVTGPNKEPSDVVFTSGLNIVRGPSNTGKSFILDCVGFLFGKDELSLGEDTGYDAASLYIHTDEGSLILQRNIGSSIIQVISENENIQSGRYSAKSTKADPGISKVWFALIGVEEVPFVIRNSTFSRQRLGWRTVSNTFLIKEDEVIRESSIFLGDNPTQYTAIMSSILYLLTGESHTNEIEKDTRAIREAKKKAVVEYISANLKSLEERADELTKTKKDSADSFQDIVSLMINEVNEIESEINSAIGESKNLLNEIYRVEGKLVESGSLLERCEVLKEQYLSDIERLGFVVEG